jgi:hypothetical protein
LESMPPSALMLYPGMTRELKAILDLLREHELRELSS